MNSKQQEFFIIGHRGAAGDYFENSIEGFQYAAGLAIDAIELDIHEHNGELWVFHDIALDRLTTGSGLLVEAADLADLRLKNGDAIPTLRQVLDILWGKIDINIEIKTIQEPRRLLRLLDEYPTVYSPSDLPPMLISSFNHRLLLALRDESCPWPLAPISHGVPAAIEQLVDLVRPWSWHFDNEYVDFALIKELRQESIQSLVYTVNQPARAAELRDHGVAGIFTDFPAQFAHTN